MGDLIKLSISECHPGLLYAGIYRLLGPTQDLDSANENWVITREHTFIHEGTRSTCHDWVITFPLGNYWVTHTHLFMNTH